MPRSPAAMPISTANKQPKMIALHSNSLTSRSISAPLPLQPTLHHCRRCAPLDAPYHAQPVRPPVQDCGQATPCVGNRHYRSAPTADGRRMPRRSARKGAIRLPIPNVSQAYQPTRSGSRSARRSRAARCLQALLQYRRRPFLPGDMSRPQWSQCVSGRSRRGLRRASAAECPPAPRASPSPGRGPIRPPRASGRWSFCVAASWSSLFTVLNGRRAVA